MRLGDFLGITPMWDIEEGAVISVFILDNSKPEFEFEWCEKFDERMAVLSNTDYSNLIASRVCSIGYNNAEDDSMYIRIF